MRAVCALLFAAATAAACATTPTPTPTGPPGTVAARGSDAGSDVVCHEEQDTGSLFSHTVCRSRQDEAQRRTDDQNWLKHPTSDPSTAQGAQMGGGPHH